MKGCEFFMTLKKVKFISTISIFALCFLFHFLYQWFPNSLFAIIFPVNESIWEHMKLLFSGICLYGIIDYFILVKNKIKFNNFFLNLFITSITSIPIYLIIFLPIYKFIGENIIISITLMFIVKLISQIISYFILSKKSYKILNYISFILIIISYIIFGYLTYNPIHNYLFLDNSKNIYGINHYKI